MDITYYLITFGCVIGSSLMSYKIGMYYGMHRFISFLQANTDSNNIIKIKITDESVEFLQ